jgi:hypothetical protein
LIVDVALPSEWIPMLLEKRLIEKVR